jgi:site-specific DNA recombinase
MDKQAAIYIRTSSEHQGQKSSPEEQERDCRQLAMDHGLTVVEVYRDIERYRAKSRLVDPSGTRVDRPGLLAMLEDAAAGKFNTIMAWKEDRLYRGLRAMLLVLDTVQQHKVDVILAKETFDPRMAPVKAWVAGMELESLKERMTMGVKARLRAGKANTGQDRYGYIRQGEDIVVVEEEAKWVRQIFAWYNDRVSMQEIRRRLIAAGAPQKGSSVPRKITWAISSIQSVLSSATEYASGIKTYSRAGETFVIPVEPLISEETYQRFLEVRAANKTYPSRNVKRDYLIAGLIYCDCGFRWGARGTSARKNGKRRTQPLGVYYCTQRHVEMRHPDCPKTIGSKKADDYVWSKVLELLSDPTSLISAARIRIDQLRDHAETATAEREQLEQRLSELGQERQWVITQARKGKITSADMEAQLATLAMEDAYTKQELSKVNSWSDVEALDDWEEAVQDYFTDLWCGIESLEDEPTTDEERKELFALKRRAVLSLVERVLMGKDREMQIVFKLDVLSVLGQGDENTSPLLYSSSGMAANKSAGTYSRR